MELQDSSDGEPAAAFSRAMLPRLRSRVTSAAGGDLTLPSAAGGDLTLPSAAGGDLTLPSPAGGDLTLPLPRRPRAPGSRGLPRHWERVATHPRTLAVALGTLVLCTLAVVVFAAAGPSVLVPRSGHAFPNWEAGPLHGLIPRFTDSPLITEIGMSVVTLVMLLAYLVVLRSARAVSMRVIAGVVLALHAILLLCPPLPLTDLFNYIGYARLGALHAINPYQHGIGMEVHDPVYRFTTWHHLKSPYGPLFTAASYPLAWLPLAWAYWTAKVVVVLSSLGFLALVWKCARLLGRDPRFAVMFVALNPVFLIYAIGGFHNDFFMLVPSTAAIALLLARRDRTAGAVLMLAVAVKFTAILLLPFLLVAAVPRQRRVRLLTGAALGAIPLATLSLVVFGLTLPNLQDQSTLLTNFSIPNVIGWLGGLGGGAPLLLRAANVLVVVAVAMLIRRRRNWLEGAGWATLALIASLAWLVPWYVVWLLPLAGLATSLRLRRAALILTVYLVVTFMPAIGPLLSWQHVDPMSGAPGQASRALQGRLAGG